VKAFGFLMLLSLAAGSASAQDVVFLKSGQTVACRIDEVTDNILNVTLTVAGGAGSARRTLPMGEIDRLEWEFRSGEEALFARRHGARSAELKPWWDLWFPHVHRPRSRAAAWGIAYGAALLREDPAAGSARALSVFDHLIAKAWSPDEVASAKEGRLRSLIAKGDLATATGEARILAKETEDPALLLEVEHLLALADFAALRTLEEEHPRWIEDDEVRPRREELYHRALDGFLKPHLFHATHEDAASRGLFSAAELFLFAGETGEARSRWDDLVKLYPETPFAAEAGKRLAALPPAPADPNDDAP